LNCFKIKNLDLFKNYKITKLKIVLPSLCLLFVVGLVYFFAFAEPADQLPQNQTFLNLAHSHINASTTAPTTYTSTSTYDTQAELEGTSPNVAGGFGYGTGHPPGKVTPVTGPEISSSESGLVGLWHMNGNWNDSKGTNHGTRYGSGIPFETTIPKLGAASGKFNGVDDYVNVDGIAVGNTLFNGNVTVELWVKLSNWTGSRDFFSVGSSIVSTRYWIVGYRPNEWPNKIAFLSRDQLNRQRNIMSINAYNNDTNWHHIAVTQEITGELTGTVSLYIDGVLQGTNSNTQASVNLNKASISNLFYNGTYTEYFNGLIDEVAIYNTALSAATIQQHYEAGSPDETSFYRSPRIDLGGVTKVASATVTKTTSTGADLKTYIRSGNSQTIDTDSIPSSTYRDTTKAEFDQGTKTNATTRSGDNLKASGNWDDFEDGVWDSALWDPDTLYPEFEEANGKLRMYNEGTGTAKLIRVGNALPSGDIEIIIDYSGVNQTGASRSFEFRFDNADGTEFAECIINQDGAWGRVMVAGTFYQGSFYSPYPSGKIKLTRTGNIMYMYDWTGSSWRQLYSYTSAIFASLVKPIVFVWAPSGATSLIYIDNFLVQNSYSTSSTYLSSPLDLGNAYFGDLLAIQADAPTGTGLTARVRAGSTATPDAASWDVAGTNWTVGSTPVSATVGTSPQVLVAPVPGGWGSYQYWQYRLDGTTNGTNTWVIRDVFLIPQATGYGRLQDITTTATNVQNCDGNRYYQWLGIGASDGSAAWDIDKTDLTSKFTAIDLGKRYNIDTLALTDTDDDLYRIHYSLQDEDTYASTTSWIDVGDLSASTTLSYT
ncbi:LamG domain-containing protein, partial [bacterium]|nr:LamG domain-containing protein [bacterium]